MALARGCFWFLPKLHGSAERLHSEEQQMLEGSSFSVIRLNSWWAKHHLTTQFCSVLSERALSWRKWVCVELQAGLQSGSLCYKASTAFSMWSRNFCRSFMWIAHCLISRVTQPKHTVLNILVHMNFSHYLLAFKEKKNYINTDLFYSMI